VLARLCDDLLDVPPIRGEIDRWACVLLNRSFVTIHLDGRRVVGSKGPS